MADDMTSGLDPDTARAVEILIAADALAAAGYVKQPRTGWRGFILRNNQILIVTLVALALAVLGLSIQQNRSAIHSDQTAAKLAKAQAYSAAASARKAAANQLSALQLICTLERATLANPRITTKQRADLHRYDTELKCKTALAQPHKPVVVPGPSASPQQPTVRRTAAPSPSPASSGTSTPTPTPRPSTTKSRSSSPSPSPSPTPCRVRDPVTGACIIH